MLGLFSPNDSTGEAAAKLLGYNLLVGGVDPELLNIRIPANSRQESEVLLMQLDAATSPRPAHRLDDTW